MEPRIGRQTPTTSLVLPYTKSKGSEAIEIYNKTNRKAREWQELLIYDIMAIDNEGMWIHSMYGYAVPRRNGKTEDVIMRIMWGLVNGEKILYTAHKISTAHSVWETITYLLDSAEIPYKSVKAKGQENIRLYDENEKAYILDHTIEFRTRSNNGGLGEGFDLLIIDEAQEYTIDQESALKYVIGASSNPQTIMLGTPPTTVSHGTVFKKVREKCLSGQAKYTGWSEWSVTSMHDPSDKDAWYETNPSLGCGLTERVIENEDTTDDVDFNVQRLGYWLSYAQQSAISLREWESLLATTTPKFKNKLLVGIKYGKDGKNVAMSIATKVEDKIFVEAIDCQSTRNGNIWMIDFLKHADVQKVAIDGAGAQNILADDLKEYGVKVNRVLPTVKEVIIANQMFEQGVLSLKNILHNKQDSLTQVISNCEKRAIGTNGGFGYKAINEEMEIALMDSVILAYWLCSSFKERRRQGIGY